MGRDEKQPPCQILRVNKGRKKAACGRGKRLGKPRPPSARCWKQRSGLPKNTCTTSSRAKRGICFVAFVKIQQMLRGVYPETLHFVQGSSQMEGERAQHDGRRSQEKIWTKPCLTISGVDFGRYSIAVPWKRRWTPNSARMWSSRRKSTSGPACPAEEATRRARLEFGGVEQVKEECRDSWGVRFISELAQDLRYGLRQLRRNPGFTAVAVSPWPWASEPIRRFSVWFTGSVPSFALSRSRPPGGRVGTMG